MGSPIVDTSVTSPADTTVQQPTTPDPATVDTAAAPATQAQPGAAPTTQQPQGMVPSYRIRETREAAIREAQQGFLTEKQKLQSELEQVRSQLHRIVGATPPEDPRVQQIRNEFGEVYPGLSKLEERAQQLLEMLESRGDTQAQQEHYWGRHGHQSVNQLFDLATKSLGTQLSDEQKTTLHKFFTGYVGSSPEALYQYAQDPQFVQNFWNSVESMFIAPARRGAAATVQTQTQTRAFPQDTPSGAPQASPAPQHRSLDERASSAWEQFRQGRS